MSHFFVNRPIVAMVIAILTVIGGAVAMFGLPVAQYPNIVPPQIRVQTTYTGADAVTIEQSVATPIEQQMSGVQNMLYMQSTNANDGTMTLQVTFDIDSGQARQARPHRLRSGAGRAAPEQRESGWPRGRQPRSPGTRVHLHRSGARTPPQARGIRRHRRAPQRRWLDGATQGRRPHRAWRGDLHRDCPPQWKACAHHRRLSDPRLECPRGCQWSQSHDRGAEEAVPGGPRLQHLSGHDAVGDRGTPRHLH